MVVISSSSSGSSSSISSSSSSRRRGGSSRRSGSIVVVVIRAVDIVVVPYSQYIVVVVVVSSVTFPGSSSRAIFNGIVCIFLLCFHIAQSGSQCFLLSFVTAEQVDLTHSMTPCMMRFSHISSAHVSNVCELLTARTDIHF